MNNRWLYLLNCAYVSYCLGGGGGGGGDKFKGPYASHLPILLPIIYPDRS